VIIYISQKNSSWVFDDSCTSPQWSEAGAGHARPSLQGGEARGPVPASGEEVQLHRNVEVGQINSQTLSKMGYSSGDWQRNTSSLTVSNINEVNSHHT